MIVESYEDVIVLSGALRSNFWDTIHTAISLTLKRHPSGVIIDCSGITECTPEGADTFRDAMDFIERFDSRIIVAAVPAAVEEVLKSVPEVRSQLPIANSVEEARRSLDILLVDESHKSKKKLTLERSDRKIAVCLSGEASDSYLLNVAGEIASASKAEIIVIYPVIVPRQLPIQAPLPELEGAAVEAFDRARKQLEDEQVPHTLRLERARDVGTAIFEVAEEVAAEQVLVALDTEVESLDESIKLVKSVLSKVNRPVLFVRGPAD